MAEQVKKAVLKIAGLVCAGTCPITLRKAFLKLDGVKDAEVNFGSSTAVVEYAPKKLKLFDLEKAVQEAGYQVINNKIAVKIGGMTCAACVRAVENALKKLEGVTVVSVNLGAEKGYITHNPQVTTLAEIKLAIEDAGYQYLGLEGEKSEDLEEKVRKKDLQEKLRIVVIGLTAGVILMLLMYLPIKLPFPTVYLMFIIATPVFLYISRPIFLSAWRALKNRNLDMDVMYAMGIGAAYLTSVLSTFGILFSHEFQFYETAVFLAAFLSMGRYLEAKAKGKTSEAIKKLVGLQPKYATIIREDKEMEIAVEDVQVNDLILVRPGEKIPTDGEVVEGESFVEEALITGEPIPNLKKKGDAVIGATINKNSVLKVRAVKIGKDTALAQIVSLVEKAQGSKLPIQRIADKVVSYFIPVVLGVAILSFIGWYFVAHSTLLFALTTLISILVVACPCALGLATPTAITVGLGRGAELGILVKNGEVFEISEKLTTVVFDKTGTLTKGLPEVTDIISSNEEELLKFTASLEKNSQHPLAEAIVRKAKEKNITFGDCQNFDTVGGKGVSGQVEGKEVLVGNRALLKEKNIVLPKEIEDNLLRLENEGKTTVLTAVDREVSGIIAIADTLKSTTKRAISELKNLKLKVVMITGDNERTARAIAKEVGIDGVLAEVLPQDKAQEVRGMQENGEVVAFVGDGINDAPALAQADVGIAIGSGTDIAIESGEVVLMKDEPLGVVAAIQLSRKVMSKIKQNLFWAFAYNIVLIPVAAGLLHPLFKITFKPELAGLAMAMSSVTVVTLSLLLKKYTPPASLGDRR